jgi:hypothetical protein
MCGEWSLRASSLQLNAILTPKASQFPQILHGTHQLARVALADQFRSERRV